MCDHIQYPTPSLKHECFSSSAKIDLLKFVTYIYLEFSDVLLVTEQLFRVAQLDHDFNWRYREVIDSTVETHETILTVRTHLFVLFRLFEISLNDL